MSRQTQRLTSDPRGTMLLVELSPLAVQQLMEYASGASSLRIILEVEPGAEVGRDALVPATLKVCPDRRVWSPPLAQVDVALAPLYDA